jgi:hypothetical protein
MLNSLSYGTIIGGSAQGVVGYIADFDGKPGNPDQIADLAHLIKHHSGQQRVITLEGTLPDEQTMWDLSVLLPIKSKKHPEGYQYRIVMLADTGNHYVKWASHCQQVVARITAPKWLCGPVYNEIWYYPSTDSNITEPDLPEERIIRDENGNSYGEIMLFVKGPAALKFAKSSPNPWRIEFDVDPIREVLWKK